MVQVALSSSPPVPLASSPWIYQKFHGKDGRIQCHERYFHQYTSSSNKYFHNAILSPLLQQQDQHHQSITYILPDAKFWRIYLPLFEELLLVSCRTTDIAVGGGGGECGKIQLVLLESVAEALEIPHQSYFRVPRHYEQQQQQQQQQQLRDDRDQNAKEEAEEEYWDVPLTNERGRIRRLMMTYGCSCLPIADLSIRTVNNGSRSHGIDGDDDYDDDDEFDILTYNQMDTITRSQMALGRAARLIYKIVRHEHHHQQAQGAGAGSSRILLKTKSPDTITLPPPPGFDQIVKSQSAVLAGAGTKDNFDTGVKQQQQLISLEKKFQILVLSDNPNIKNDILDNDETIDVFANGTKFVEHIVSLSLLPRKHPQHTINKSNDKINNMTEQLLHIVMECEQDYERRCIIESSNDITNSNSCNEYKPYLSFKQLQLGLASHRYMRGRLDVNKRCINEAYVTVRQHSTMPSIYNANGGQEEEMRLATFKKKTHNKYLIDNNRKMFNRSFHNDVVVIEVLSEKEWSIPQDNDRSRLLVHQRDDNEEEEKIRNDRNGKHIQDGDGNDGNTKVPTARVVGILEHTKRQFVATIVANISNSITTADGTTSVDTSFTKDSHMLVVPMDIRIPKIRIRTRPTSLSIWINKRLLVQVDGWEVETAYPLGHVVDVIGPVADVDTEVKCLLYEHDLMDISRPFSAASLACLPSDGENWTIDDDVIGSRRDMRQCCRIFSVDPPGCTDIDDAVHLRQLSNGNYEVGVHIADVDYFVPQSCPLDHEASARATTFYLVDRRYDMLPSLLSSNLCSLHGGKDRLAISIMWELSSDMKDVLDCWAGRTVVRNCQAMTYEQAHRIMLSEVPNDPEEAFPPALTAGGPVEPSIIPYLRNDLKILTKLAQIRREEREEVGGAVDLSSGERGSELKFVLDKSTGRPMQVSAKLEIEIHRTIAELMIMANREVAERIYKYSPSTSLLRIHQSIPTDENNDKLGDFDKIIQQAGGRARDGTSNKLLAMSLKQAKSDGAVEALLQSLAVRAMSEAKYVCTGALESGIESLTHFGLGIDRYTHFTSPIRRYADLVVHRQLITSLTNVTSIYTQQSESNTFRDLSPKIIIPESQTMSVLLRSQDSAEIESGTRISDDIEDGDDLIDDLIKGASELALRCDTTTKTSIVPQRESSKLDKTTRGSGKAVMNKRLDSYTTKMVSRICLTLNHRTRMARLASLECQGLFLSLYLKNSFECAMAVVLGLRTNGVLAYVPKFDLKAPVYLSDRHGTVHMNPATLGVPVSEGFPPDAGFASVSTTRSLPKASCNLVSKERADGGDDSYLSVIMPGANPFELKKLDVITVQLSCELKIHARIPSPRLHLLGKDRVAAISADHSDPSPSENVAKVFTASNVPTFSKIRSEERVGEINKKEKLQSIYSIIDAIEICPALAQSLPNPGEHRENAERKQLFPGRFVFGKVPISASPLQGRANNSRANISQTERNNMSYDKVRQIEREVTSRAQRLAAEKRNSRRGKASR